MGREGRKGNIRFFFSSSDGSYNPFTVTIDFEQDTESQVRLRTIT